jgi:ubiquinone/menaquinone biosynthesis C-methylase UbiE
MNEFPNPAIPDYRAIYATRARDYDRLVAREDIEGNIWRALHSPEQDCTGRLFEGADVVELGAGTGRLTCMLAPMVQRIWAFDVSRHMLHTARAKLEGSGLRNWELAVADNRRLPVGDGVADVAIAGWSLGHLVAWHPDSWRGEIGRALREMERALRPGGTVILLETLGTGEETPRPPHAGLAAYYGFLEQERGFSSTWMRTDYVFASLDEAEELTRFFFGAGLAERVRREGLVRLPECTGLWWKERREA